MKDQHYFGFEPDIDSMYIDLDTGAAIIKESVRTSRANELIPPRASRLWGNGLPAGH